MIKTILIGALCAFLCFGCSDEPKEEHVIVKKQETQQYVPPHFPSDVNPFAKPGPAPQYPPFQEPHWVQVGGEFKINEHWSFWTWRDEANFATCYLTIVDSNAAQMSMSCVRE
jgi:hypothetical protein